jgi:hypothetical protein
MVVGRERLDRGSPPTLLFFLHCGNDPRFKSAWVTFDPTKMIVGNNDFSHNDNHCLC